LPSAVGPTTEEQCREGSTVKKDACKTETKKKENKI
jgi:hypothetical protein